MERKKYILILLILTSVQLSGDNYKDRIYNSFISGNMDSWKVVIDEMFESQNRSKENVTELLNYQYGYIGWSISKKQYTQAKILIKKSETMLALLGDDNRSRSLTSFYQSVFYAYSIPFNKLKVATYGKKSLEEAKKSLEEDPTNPYSHIQYANCYYYMPAFFGGSKKIGLEHYLTAKDLMELNAKSIKKDWNYLNLLAQIAIVYADLHQYETSKLYLDKILLIEPSIKWVRNELYPKLIKTKNSE